LDDSQDEFSSRPEDLQDYVSPLDRESAVVNNESPNMPNDKVDIVTAGEKKYIFMKRLGGLASTM
jgi:hypothetical protein